jgi:hypothetical protein
MPGQPGCRPLLVHCYWPLPRRKAFLRCRRAAGPPRTAVLTRQTKDNEMSSISSNPAPAWAMFYGHALRGPVMVSVNFLSLRRPSCRSSCAR